MVARGVGRHAGASIEHGELRSFLGKTLPDAMLPAFFVELEKLPMTTSGKIDRRALPKPEAVRGLTDELVAPRNPTEELVAESRPSSHLLLQNRRHGLGVEN